MISVERDNVRAAPVCLKCVPPATAAKIEQPVTRPDGELAEVHGQQCQAPFAAARALAAAISRSYSTTTALATADQVNLSWTRCQAA